MHVASVPTNIRDWRGSTEFYGNSIFLFESAGLCIAHLSHLHHLLTEQDLVTLEGKIKLHNYEKRTAEITITNPIPGKPTTADQQGTVAVDPTKLRLTEREGSVRWQVKLEPGEEKTLTYQYERYVPSN